jgi:hypothetical protein
VRNNSHLLLVAVFLRRWSLFGTFGSIVERAWSDFDTGWVEVEQLTSAVKKYRVAIICEFCIVNNHITL